MILLAAPATANTETVTDLQQSAPHARGHGSRVAGFARAARARARPHAQGATRPRAAHAGRGRHRRRRPPRASQAWQGDPRRKRIRDGARREEGSRNARQSRHRAVNPSVQSYNLTPYGPRGPKQPE